jgi:hypothetical protein
MYPRVQVHIQFILTTNWTTSSIDNVNELPTKYVKKGPKLLQK